MTQSGYMLVGLTVILAVLAGVVAFAVLRFIAAARDTRSHRRGGGAETALLSAALQEAVTKLKAQEQAMSARAAASEQLSGQIIDSLSSGLLVVNRSGRIEMLNLAARRLLGDRGRDHGRAIITRCSLRRRRSSTPLPNRWRRDAPSCAAPSRCPQPCPLRISA